MLQCYEVLRVRPVGNWE